MITRRSIHRGTRILAWVLVVGVVSVAPVAHAQEVVAAAEVAATEGATESVQGPRQGENQGVDQGVTNGGPTLNSLGLTPDENGAYDTSVLGKNDPRQGARQGVDAGSPAARAAATADATVATSSPTRVDAGNTQTGSDSTNTSSVTTTSSKTTTVDNTSAVANTGTGTARTGGNTASENTGAAAVTTGNASIGVQQVTVDNLATTGSSSEVEHTVAPGSQSGDLVLEFTPQSATALTESFRSVNSVTGSGSDNTAEITSTRDTLVEIQNDGTIANTLHASAVSGQNDASQNTGNATVATGDANVAVTLFNFLNASVVDGALWLSVSDIFGDLGGNVVIPEEAVSYLERRQRKLLVNAENGATGSGSSNTLDVTVTETSTTTLTNTADIHNDVTVDAVTGQNTATQNTGGATILTGDVQTTANVVTLANMNVVEGNLGVVIVNALNRWLGFLLGQDGSWTPISHEYSTVDVANNATGSGSTNAATVDVSATDTTDVSNKATVRNTLDLSAITGQNTVTQNTGNANVRTGDARVNATVVNVVNTNVVRGSLFVMVVNIFGNWFGDLLFGGHAVAALDSSSGNGIAVQATNTATGADSTNTIAVDAERLSDVTVENTAVVRTSLVVDADTGNNVANRNTGLARVETGDAEVALHARNIANVTVAGIGSAWGDVTAELLNDTTGVDSTNTIDVTVNDERAVTVTNAATVDTAIGAVANTGLNTTNRNTLGGLILTGVANISALVDNLLNQTWFTPSAYGDDPRVAIGLANQTTGAGSTNTNAVTPSLSTSATVANAADVGTTVDALSRSGGNESQRNTGGGAVGTRTASVAGGVANTVNGTELRGTPGGVFSLTGDNAATVETAFTGSATTGANLVNRNTGLLALPLSPANGSGGSVPGHGSASPLGSGASLPVIGGGASSSQSGDRGGGSGSSGSRSGSSSEVSDEPAPPQVKKRRVASRSGRVRSVRRVRGVGIVSPRTPRISAIGPVFRFPAVVSVAKAADDREELATALTDLSADTRGGVGDALAAAWPWAFLAAALTLLGRTVGGGKILSLVSRIRGR